MNDIFSSSFGILAHGFHRDPGGAVFVLVVMTLYLLVLLICRKYVKIKGLIFSSLISYILVSFFILDYTFKLQIPEIIGKLFEAAVGYPNFLILLIFWSAESSTGFFVFAFIEETLIIFGIIRLILYIKHEISAKKRQAV